MQFLSTNEQRGRCPASADGEAQGQVMLNLMINALEAMSAANVGELNSSDPSLAGNRDPRRWRQLRTPRIERLELRAERAHLR